MVEQVAEGDVLFVAIAQAGNILACLIIKAELAVIKGFHHTADGARRLGYRGKAKERVVVNLDTAAVVDGAERIFVNHLAMTCHNHLAAREGMLLHTQAAHRVDLCRQTVVQTSLGGNGVSQSTGGIVDAVASIKSGLLAVKRQRNGQIAVSRVSAKDGLCRIVLGKGGVLVGEHYCLDMLVGDGGAVVLDVVGLAGDDHNDVFALLDHSG